MIREAEGQAEAILKVQKANADGLRFLKDAGADETVLALKSFEALTKCGRRQSNQDHHTIGTAECCRHIDSTCRDCKKPRKKRNSRSGLKRKYRPFLNL